jgi:hypothetical protein
MGMDFVMGLPKTKNGYTAIVTFVDRLTKMVHLWPCTDAVTAEETMEIFLKAVWRIHGVPKEIVSDRDPRFVSDFWQALHKRLGTRFNMSTANHPQTDGQAERANGLIEEVLRSYVNIHQNDWDEHLSTVEYAANDAVQASTGVTAFQGHLWPRPDQPAGSDGPAASARGRRGGPPAAREHQGILRAHGRAVQGHSGLHPSGSRAPEEVRQ